MEDRTATVIIEARTLMREALVSLMESHSYRVIGSIASIADVGRSVFNNGPPKIVILGTLPTECVADVTNSIRRCWQGAKIIMLSENASLNKLQKLLGSGLDACVPVFVSPRTLIDVLQLIISERLRILMVSDSALPRPLMVVEEAGDGETMEDEESSVANLASSVQVPSSAAAPHARGLLLKNTDDSADAYGLSERERKILKALVRGYSNKMIARMCSVTEVTVKVHMTSILRKIRAANRTQAAIWALKNAYFSEGIDAEGSRKPKDIQEMLSA